MEDKELKSIRFTDGFMQLPVDLINSAQVDMGIHIDNCESIETYVKINPKMISAYHPISSSGQVAGELTCTLVYILGKELIINYGIEEFESLLNETIVLQYE